MTQLEQNIYNTYIAVSRSKQNKPFTLRKDFEKIEPSQALYTKKIALFLQRYPHIKLQDFIQAPYEIYPNEQMFLLQYYTTRAAIKSYSLYIKKKEDLSPVNQLESIRESLHYIGMFCIKNKIKLHEYLYHKTGCINSWMLHYKEHHINIYSLFELGDIQKICMQVAADEQKLLTENLIENIGKFKTRYYNTPTVKDFVRQGLKKIESFLNFS